MKTVMVVVNEGGGNGVLGEHMREVIVPANGVKAVCTLEVDSSGTDPPGTMQEGTGTGSAIEWAEKIKLQT